MECYEGATMIKTFRGLIVDGAQDTIVLHTNDGSTGYRIVKFEVVHQNEVDDLSATLNIFTVSQSSASFLIDFSDQTLLASAAYRSDKVTTGQVNTTIIFDRMVFNQDIYITYKDNENAGLKMNYYIELEQFKLDLSESTVATLKDIRNEHRIPPG